MNAQLPDTLWSVELIRTLLPTMPRDDLPLEAAKLCMHPLDYAQLRHCAQEAGLDPDRADVMKPFNSASLIITESQIILEGQVGVFDRQNNLLGIIQLGH